MNIRLDKVVTSISTLHDITIKVEKRPKTLAEMFTKALDHVYIQLDKKMESGFHKINERIDGKNIIGRVEGLEGEMKIVSGKLGLAM